MTVVGRGSLRPISDVNLFISLHFREHMKRRSIVSGGSYVLPEKKKHHFPVAGEGMERVREKYASQGRQDGWTKIVWEEVPFRILTSKKPLVRVREYDV
jgi:hypothetical protein